MILTTERADAREWPREPLAELFSEGFPAFITADRLVKEYIGRVREWFADLDLMLVDEDGAPVAAGWGVPVGWDGQVGTLPTGYTDALVRAVEGRERGVEPDTLVICGAVVTPALQGRGLAGRMLSALRETGRAAGLERVVAPVRPTTKARYPVTPIDAFMRWRRPDGTAMDPWIRTHERLGARILAAAPASQTMTGTVAEWERWTGLALPESGEYVIPDGLSVLRVDVEADAGVYEEPNVWMRHH
ncbi:GNAT family N-acetyltransferase [Streptomyces sp. BK239]|uniref:GNAT family N-acetyltransferase n=1 Tax=Streptomyces sp. BK239 TaxID=2512155 RepID=UPI00102B9897|nr:GNAT family N-acetyltransferase [Streptomyces sp. BK239]RZU10795.1 acetyltransferase (GNAT) family protein [Streptomyces sp. BK239]